MTAQSRAARYAVQSDPDFNRQFRRPWLLPEGPAPRALPEGKARPSQRWAEAEERWGCVTGPRTKTSAGGAP